MHGPDTHAHGSRPARKPGKTNSAACGGCAAREVKSGVGSKHRNQDRERNKAVVVMTDHRFSRHRSSLHMPFLNPSPWRECIFKCDDVTRTPPTKAEVTATISLVGDCHEEENISLRDERIVACNDQLGRRQRK